jgi:LysM repeat protein
MDRKKTILITAAVNAGLLILLFVVAMVREEEHPYGSKGRSYDSPPTLVENNRPLFCEPQELPLTPVQEQPFAALPTPMPAPQELVHQLPPIVQQKEPLMQPPAVATVQSKILEVSVKKGDTLEKIAKAHQTTVNELLQLNHLSSNFLRIGQVLKVPAVSNAPLAASKPKIEKSFSDGQVEYYVVKVGDNPWTIAMKHHMKIDELLKLNQMNEEKARRLKPGDRLRIR